VIRMELSASNERVDFGFAQFDRRHRIRFRRRSRCRRIRSAPVRARTPDVKAAGVAASRVIDRALGSKRLRQQSTTARRLHPCSSRSRLICQGVLGVGVHRDIVGPTAFGGFERLFPPCPPPFDPISVG
jgi:hypothetical protein